MLNRSVFNCPYDPDEPLYIIYDVNEHVTVYLCGICGYRENVNTFACIEG